MTFNSKPDTKKTLVSWSVTPTVLQKYDWQGREQLWSTGVAVNANFQHQTSVLINVETGYERLLEEEFGPKRSATRPGRFFGAPDRSTRQAKASIVGNSALTNKLSVFGFLNLNTSAFDLDFGALPRYPRASPAGVADPYGPLDPGPGRQVSWGASAAFQASSNIQLSLDFSSSWLRRYDTKLLAYRDDIYSLNASYQASRAWSIRARIDHDTLSASTFGQFQTEWSPSPGTAFYAGYNSTVLVNGFNFLTLHPESGIRRYDQVFFVKFAYLFRRTLN